MPPTHPALPEVRSISGDALVAALDLAETVARWSDALPNDPDTFRAAARLAQDVMALARENSAKARAAARIPLSLEDRAEVMKARWAYFRARAQAGTAATREFGLDWGKLPGNRVLARCSRELRIYVSKTGRISYDPAIQIVPARRFWIDTPPEGLTFGEDAPCMWRPDPSRLRAEGRAWAAKQDAWLAQQAA